MTIGLYRTLFPEWIYFREAENKYDAKDYKATVILYRKSLEAGLPQSKIGINLPNAYVAIGQFEDAIVWYKNYLSMHPKDNNARLALAKALSWIGKTHEAELEYQKILENTYEKEETK